MTRSIFSLFLIILPTFLAAQDARRPVIAVAGILHETNTFNPKKTELADFEGSRVPNGIRRGTEMLQGAGAGAGTLAGIVEGARNYDLELHPIMHASAQPGGMVTASAFNALMEELLHRLKSGPKLGGVVLMLHGAMVSEDHAYADEEIVRRVRNTVGKTIPIIVTHDFHANVSDEIVALSNVLVTYKENPHLDVKDRGLQAIRIMADTVRGKTHPVQVIVRPPMIYNIVFQNTFEGPIKPVVDESKRIEKTPKVLAVSVPGGYQYADVPAMGPAVIVVTDGDRELAKREAQRLSDMLWATREQLQLNLPDAAGAVQLALKSDKFPVVLLDTGDNIGGGSSGDSTFLLAELIRQKATGWVVAIADADATEAAIRAGISGQFNLRVGGKTDQFHGAPVAVEGRVKSLHDGRFIEPEVRHGGSRNWDMGPTAVIEVEGSTLESPNLIVLTRKRVAPYSLHQLISCGIYPERQKILVVKGTIAPRAAYEPIAARLIQVDTRGLTAVNPAHFTFKSVRKGLFGLSR